MLTIDCKDPECKKCQLAASGLNSKKELFDEFEMKILHTLEHEVLQDVIAAARAKKRCLANCLMVKKEIQESFYELIDALKKRELALCWQADKMYEAQVDEIDSYWSLNSAKKITKKKFNEIAQPNQTLVFHKNILGVIERSIPNLGSVEYEDTQKFLTETHQCIQNIKKFSDENASKVNNIAECGITNEFTKDREQFIQMQEEQERMRRKRFQSWLQYEKKMLQIYKEMMESCLNVNIDTDQRSDCKSSALSENCEEDLSFRDYVKRKLLQAELPDRPTENPKRDEIASGNLNTDLAPIKEAVKDKIPEAKLSDRPTENSESNKIACLKLQHIKSVSLKDLKKDSNLPKEYDREAFMEQTVRLLMEQQRVQMERQLKLQQKSMKEEDIGSSLSSESIYSSPTEELEKDSSLDEDDIEIISRDETDSIPSDICFSPPLPPKQRFKFGRNSGFASLLRKKKDAKLPLSPENDATSESSGIGQSASSMVNASDECQGGSEVEGNNPTATLRSSFTKYLEKNPENEWLASGKSSEQWLSKEDSCKKRVVPIIDQEYNQWLTAAFNQKKASD